MLRTIVTIIFIVICIALIILVMLQESKSTGLTGAVSGMSESYWGKNKGRSMEGKLIKWTAILAVILLALAVILNMNW